MHSCTVVLRYSTNCGRKIGISKLSCNFYCIFLCNNNAIFDYYTKKCEPESFYVTANKITRLSFISKPK